MQNTIFFFLYSFCRKSFCNSSFPGISGLSRKIMRGIALALGGSPYEFEGEKGGDPFWVMRIIGYPGVSHAYGLDMPENDIGW